MTERAPPIADIPFKGRAPIDALLAALEAGADLLVVNRFGKAEADGSGLRPVIARAIAEDIPVLVPVREDYAPAWAAFNGGLAASLPAEAEAVLDWCRRAVRRQVSA